MNDAFQARRDIILAEFDKWPGVTCPRPSGAFYAFPVMEAFYTKEAPDSTALCTKILEEAGVALVPGAAFGDDRCIRFSYAVDEAVLKKSLEKITKVLVG